LRIYFGPLTHMGFLPTGVYPSQEAASTSSVVLFPRDVFSRGLRRPWPDWDGRLRRTQL